MCPWYSAVINQCVDILTSVFSITYHEIACVPMLVVLYWRLGIDNFVYRHDGQDSHMLCTFNIYAPLYWFALFPMLHQLNACVKLHYSHNHTLIGASCGLIGSHTQDHTLSITA